MRTDPKCCVLVFEIRAVLVAELLPELYGTCRASFNALAARYAVLFCNLGGIGASRKIRRVKQKRCAKSVAYLNIAVTYIKYLIFTVNVCNLVNKTVFFCLFKYFVYFFSCYVTSTFVSFNNIICHIAYSNTPAFRIIGTAFVICNS